MSTKKQLLDLFDKMENERLAILKALETDSEEALTQKPAPNHWSVAEVVQHLSKAEEGALKYMRIKLEHGGHKKASFGAALKQKLLNLAISLPIKYKAPNVIKLDENADLSFAKAVEDWTEIRNTLRSEYEQVDEELIDHELFKHPAAGKLSIYQSVKFMRQHLQRHKGQIERTIKHVRSAN